MRNDLPEEEVFHITVKAFARGPYELKLLRIMQPGHNDSHIVALYYKDELDEISYHRLDYEAASFAFDLKLQEHFFKGH